MLSEIIKETRARSLKHQKHTVNYITNKLQTLVSWKLTYSPFEM